MNQMVYNELVNLYEENHALARKASLLFNDVGEALNWCSEMRKMLEENNESVVEALKDEVTAGPNEPVANDEDTINTLVSRFSSLVSMQLDESKNSIEQILPIWKTYREKVVADSTSDYLSLDYLAQFLKHLSVSSNFNSIHRTLPTQILSSERANFVLCPELSVFQLVLSLYMIQQDSPLPTHSEMLLCTADTTAEEVELIFSRALTPDPKGNGKLYVILWTDKLRAETTREFEESLRAMCNTNPKFSNPLIIISTAKSIHEQDAFLMSSLDVNLVDFHSLRPFFSSLEKIQAWIKSKLCLADTNNFCASAVDPENCSIRLVTSEKAGMGKSVFVHRRVEELHSLLGGNQTFWQNFSPHVTNNCISVSISLHQKYVESNDFIEQLFLWRNKIAFDESSRPPAVIHLDISHEVREGLDRLLFSLLILGTLRSSDGYVWLRNKRDLYIIENTPLLQRISTSGI